MTLYVCKLPLFKTTLKTQSKEHWHPISGPTLPPSAHSHTRAPATESRLCYFSPHRTGTEKACHPHTRLCQPLTLFCIDNQPKGSDVFSILCI